MARLRDSWLLLIVVTISTPGDARAQGACDRGCLRAALDQYLAAVIKHDPSAAPLMTGFRQTENAVAVPPGGGVWKTVTGLGKVQRRYVDPVSGQAAYFGVIGAEVEDVGTPQGFPTEIREKP